MKTKIAAFLIAFIAVAAFALAGYNTLNYMEPGGAVWNVGGRANILSGGSLMVASGGKFNVASGGYLEIAGTRVTASAASLNTLTGTTIVRMDYKNDPTSYTATGTQSVQDGTTIVVPADILTANKAFHIVCTGTSVGNTTAKEVLLYIDDAAILDFSTGATTIGDWVAEYWIAASSTSAQRVWGRVTFQNAGTTFTAVDYSTDTTNFSTEKTIKTQLDTDGADATVVQTACLVEFLP